MWLAENTVRKLGAVDVIFPSRGLEKGILEYIILPPRIVLTSLIPVDEPNWMNSVALNTLQQK